MIIPEMFTVESPEIPFYEAIDLMGEIYTAEEARSKNVNRRAAAIPSVLPRNSPTPHRKPLRTPSDAVEFK